MKFLIYIFCFTLLTFQAFAQPPNFSQMNEAEMEAFKADAKYNPEKLQALVDHGDPWAMGRLGILYLFGDNGLNVDKCYALKLFDQGARLGDPFSQIELVDAYRYGKGLKRSDFFVCAWGNAAIKSGADPNGINYYINECEHVLSQEEMTLVDAFEPEKQAPAQIIDHPYFVLISNIMENFIGGRTCKW